MLLQLIVLEMHMIAAFSISWLEEQQQGEKQLACGNEKRKGTESDCDCDCEMECEMEMGIEIQVDFDYANETA